MSMLIMSKAQYLLEWLLVEMGVDGFGEGEVPVRGISDTDAGIDLHPLVGLRVHVPQDVHPRPGLYAVVGYGALHSLTADDTCILQRFEVVACILYLYAQHPCHADDFTFGQVGAIDSP